MAKYTCTCCGKEHDEWPALGFAAPLAYAMLSEEDRANEDICELTTDLCVVRYPNLDRVDYYVRAVLLQKVIDHCDALEYGVWTSLSEKSFMDYYEHFENQEYEAGYFGWLGNALPDYEFNVAIPLDVIYSGKGQRPELVPHENVDHPFIKDYYNGITKAEAERRIAAMLANM
ncbi:DUF2199 domain-containing protein [Chitinophaga sp. Cy-1792]|uniref:DUF2199 domain-containing protein n=1 Tax=Chitinophaga sp. Cy-1792 TaxID=2608339 RepID=UPI0014233E53|nr:DUF2199 domain-containing protein [Chitinophaga sp. Cy-1792]NIG56412.1 DUF2199 domain-containing protein [Chitinophaga sp. Cy-1792]